MGDVRRFATKNHFASSTGTAPVSASSGNVQRHRLNRGGNRRPNRAIHTVALVQAQIDARDRAYMQRRRAEGKSWREDCEVPGSNPGPPTNFEFRIVVPALQQEAAGHTRGTDSLESRCDHAS